MGKHLISILSRHIYRRRPIEGDAQSWTFATFIMLKQKCTSILFSSGRLYLIHSIYPRGDLNKSRHWWLHQLKLEVALSGAFFWEREAYSQHYPKYFNKATEAVVIVAIVIRSFYDHRILISRK